MIPIICFPIPPLWLWSLTLHPIASTPLVSPHCAIYLIHINHTLLLTPSPCKPRNYPCSLVAFTPSTLPLTPQISYKPTPPPLTSGGRFAYYTLAQPLPHNYNHTSYLRLHTVITPHLIYAPYSHLSVILTTHPA